MRHEAVRIVGLKTFIRQTCCNWVNGACIFGDGTCKVLANRAARCAHFELCLLPQANEGQVAEYAAATKAGTRKVRAGGKPQRYCECGTPLLPRHRCCEECRRERKRRSNRLSERQRRKARRTVDT